VESFTVEGMISLPKWDSGDEGERRITCAAEKGAVLRPLATLRSVHEGRWGPISLPILDVDRYVIRVEGLPVIPLERYIERPAAGHRIFLDLAPLLGEQLWFVALDDNDQPIKEARALLGWMQEGERRTLEVQARADAFINVKGVPPGTIDYQVFAPGFAPSHRFQIGVPLSEQQVNPVHLSRSGRLIGRCVYNGSPVEDFELVVWPERRSRSRVTHVFHGREDGRFSVDDVPAKTLFVVAASSELPGSDPVRVEVNPGETAEILIELPEARTARGIIVDSTTGDPIQEATIQFYYTGVAQGITAWGPPHPVRPDGGFEFAGFTDRENYFFASAPNYSGFYSSIVPASLGVIDLGRIRLDPLQGLEVALISTLPQQAVDCTQFQIRAHGPSPLPATRFPSSGVVSFDAVSTGEYTLWIDCPKAFVYQSAVRLSSGGGWRLEYPVAGPNLLTVELVSGEGTDPGTEYTVQVDYTSSDGSQTKRWGPVGANDPAEFAGITDDFIRVMVADPRTEEILLVRDCRFGLGGHIALPVVVEQRGILARVVNRAGLPVADVRVDIEDPNNPQVVYMGTTNAEGEVRILGVPEEPVVAHLHHSALGRQYGVACNGAEDEIEILFESEAFLTLMVMDGSHILEGVLCSIRSPIGRLHSRTPSNDSGTVQFAALGPGHYDIHAERRDCWPVDRRVEVKEGGTQVDLQMRRLGGVEVEIVSREGLGVRGQVVGVRSVEFDCDVADWLAEGRVQSETRLVTDSKGHVRIEGLPRGSYRWTIALEGGKTLESVIEVPAARVGQERIVLP